MPSADPDAIFSATMHVLARIDFEALTSAFSGWVWATPLFFLLLGCGILFSVFSKFVQWRILSHGYACIRGHYDRPDDIGHINHFQALCAALSATIGLGNIAGVAVAVSLGGPGAVFWMWVVGLFGMALKFMECSLAVMYRDVQDRPDPSAPDLVEVDTESRTLEYAGQQPPETGASPRARGEVRGGPMWYMQKALVEPLRARGNILWVPFKVLAILFAISTMLNSFGGGNMFQGWNVADVLSRHFHMPTFVSASVVSFLVALVIIGGIRRIGQVASKLVPFMCVLYVAGALVVILLHASAIPACLRLIVASAFTSTAEGGAFAGVTMWVAFEWGLKRACFSNEAGEGSAAMAHAAARTDQPIREGVVAGIGPFVDTLIICTMSALVLLMTDTWKRPPVGEVVQVSETQVVVDCSGAVPEKFEALYLRRIMPQVDLTVHIDRGRDANGQWKELKTLDLPILAVDGTTDSDWKALRGVTLDLTKAKKEDQPKVQTGQSVFLGMTGADLTGFAFDTTLTGFGTYLVTIGVCLFAFSTMISWSYYGEKGAEYLLGSRAILPFKFTFVIFVFVGMVAEKFEPVYNFSDATTGLMVLCNLPAVLILSPVVIRAARTYFRKLDGGQFPRRDR